MKPIWNGLCLLDLQIQALEPLNHKVVLATTINESDDLLEEWAKKNQLDFFRGEEENVLNRFVACAQYFGGQNIIRVCSDNPFIQFDQVHRYFDLLNGEVDYVSYSTSGGLPAIKTHWGLFVEGIRVEALQKCQKSIQGRESESYYQEHVTNFIYENASEFALLLEEAPASVVNRDDLRFTVDTTLDFQNMSELLRQLGGNTRIDLNKLIEMVSNQPEILERMAVGINDFKK